jgi:hypothetical protein
MGEPVSAERCRLSSLRGMANGNGNPKILVPAPDGELRLSKMPSQGRQSRFTESELGETRASRLRFSGRPACKPQLG